MRNPLSLDPRLIECILSGKPIVGEPTGNGTGVVEPVVRPAAGIPCPECKGTKLGHTSIASPTLKWCPACGGTGIMKETEPPPCWACDEERKRGLFLDEHVHKCWLKEVA
jgi:hypothetical protein